jgi:hypothetical protein
MRWPSSTAMFGVGLHSAESADQAPSPASEASAMVAAREDRRLPRQGAVQASRTVVAQSKIVPGSSTRPKKAPSLAAHHDQTKASMASSTSAAGSTRWLEPRGPPAGVAGACGPAGIVGKLLIDRAGPGRVARSG